MHRSLDELALRWGWVCSEQRNTFDMSWIENGLMEQILVSTTASRVTPLVNTPGRYAILRWHRRGSAEGTGTARTCLLRIGPWALVAFGGWRMWVVDHTIRIDVALGIRPQASAHEYSAVLPAVQQRLVGPSAQVERPALQERTRGSHTPPALCPAFHAVGGSFAWQSRSTVTAYISCYVHIVDVLKSPLCPTQVFAGKLSPNFAQALCAAAARCLYPRRHA